MHAGAGLHDCRVSRGNPCANPGFAYLSLPLASLALGSGVNKSVHVVWNSPAYGFVVMRGDFPNTFIAPGRLRETASDIAAAGAIRATRGARLILTAKADGCPPLDMISIRVPTGESGTLELAVLTAPGVDLSTGESEAEPSMGVPTDRSRGLTVAAADIMAANSARIYAWIQNIDATINCFIRLGADATTATGHQLRPGAIYEMSREAGNLFLGRISGIAASGTPSILAGEANEG